MELGKLIAISYRQYQSFMREVLKDYSLGNTDYPVLLVLNKKPGMNLNEVSRCIRLSKSIISRSVSKLVEEGYIEQLSDENHRQRMKLYLTDRGREVLPYIEEGKRQWQEEVLKGSSQEDMESFLRVLTNIYENSLDIK